MEQDETLEEGAVREVSEETGLNIEEKNLVPLCCWQEFYIPKRIQYLMMVYFTVCSFLLANR